MVRKNAKKIILTLLPPFGPKTGYENKVHLVFRIITKKNNTRQEKAFRIPTHVYSTTYYIQLLFTMYHYSVSGRRDLFGDVINWCVIRLFPTENN